ncbi:MAG TPA: chromosome segregation protein SMC, partial [Mucilaginibacter sp.]|nr:chromosome segregation protein SMC [Mucilaginibacter sp.]
EQESDRNIEDTVNKEVELSHFNDAVADLENKAGSMEKDLHTLVKYEENLQKQIRDAESQSGEVKESIIRESRKLDAKQNEYNLTKSMVDNLEGFPESIRFLKKTQGWAKNAPLFSDILFCKEEYRVAIENYLEPLMNYYVVEDYNEAIAAINLLSNSSQGRAQFFVLSNYKDKSKAVDAGIDGVPALSVVEVESRYQNLCDHLLKNVYLVSDSTEKDLNGASLPEGVVVIGKSGKFNKSKLTMAGGSVGLFEGKRIGRAKNLENLAKELKSLDSKIGDLKNQSEDLRNKLVALRSVGKSADIANLQNDLNRLNTELVTVKTRQEQYQAFIENSRNRKEDIARKVESIKEDILKAQPELVELKAQKQVQADLLTDKQRIFNELNEETAVQSNTYNQENIRFHQQQNKVNGLVKDMEYRETQKESLETRINQNSAELEKVKQAISENMEQTGHSDEDLLEMYKQKEQLEKGTQQAEQEYYAMRGKITETEDAITALRRKKEQSEVIENELKDQKNNLKLELNALKERLSVEFNIDIEELLNAEPPAGENEHDLREKTEKIKRQLDDFGPINPLAVEAYNEMNQRYEFIQAQKKDLSEAKASLLTTIKEIDDTARDKFMQAFENVRENFIKVFRSLFNEGDSCDLILIDPDNPLESDIDIIARPKGKRPLSINQLSGGEKTLTATAILFSLYLLKPAPFCIFDEVDAPLDDTNIDKFNNIIRDFSSESQFIIVSHNKRTIASTDVIYGVTMVEQGVSRVVPVDLRELAD